MSYLEGLNYWQKTKRLEATAQMRKNANKGKKFNPSHEEIQKAIEEFKACEGKIKKLASTKEIDFFTKPYISSTCPYNANILDKENILRNE